MPKAPRKGIRDDLYRAMRAALVDNMGFVYIGRDGATGAQVGNGTLTMLKRRKWVRPVYAQVVNPATGQRRRMIAGGWITNLGRSAMRDEVLRRGDDMPARLVLPARPRRSATPIAPPRRPVTPAHPVRPRRAVVAAPPAAPNRSITADVDPFALVATGSPADTDIPF